MEISFAGWHQNGIWVRRSIGEFAGSQGHRHGQIIIHSTAGTHVNLATVRLLLAQVAKLAQKFRIVEQFDLALHQQVFDICCLYLWLEKHLSRGDYKKEAV
jgi:hypothetical protein